MAGVAGVAGGGVEAGRAWSPVADESEDVWDIVAVSFRGVGESVKLVWVVKSLSVSSVVEVRVGRIGSGRPPGVSVGSSRWASVEVSSACSVSV